MMMVMLEIERDTKGPLTFETVWQNDVWVIFLKYIEPKETKGR